MKTIKIGRKIFNIKVGDYILDNGACLQFCTGDGRTLYIKGYHSFTNIVLPKTVIAKIDFSSLRKTPSRNKNCTEYIFNKIY